MKTNITCAISFLSLAIGLLYGWLVIGLDSRSPGWWLIWTWGSAIVFNVGWFFVCKRWWED